MDAPSCPATLFPAVNPDQVCGEHSPRTDA